MQRTMKRFGALLLALAMLVSFMPTFGLAESAHAEDEEKDGITVYMTVSNKGIIAEDKDGDAMAWREIFVKDIDEDGKYSYDEALVAAHDACFEGGAEAGYKQVSGGVKTLWGDTSGNFLFFVNGVGNTDGITAVNVTEGDLLTVSVNADTTFYADWVSMFNKAHRTVEAGQKFCLNLKGHLGMAWDEADMQDVPLKGVNVGTWEDGEFKKIDGVKTDAEGDAILSFDEPGTYIVTANGTVKGTATDYRPDGISPLINEPESGKTAYGWYEMDEETFDMTCWFAYTEHDYGNGPYPEEEVLKTEGFDFYEVNSEWEQEDFDDLAEKYNLIRSNKLIVDCPIMAPACIVTVKPAPIEVSLTVNNKGILAEDKDKKAMADRTITVVDENEDGQFTVDEALKAAHAELCPAGAEGYTTGPSYYGGLQVTGLWGVTTTNTLFFVNNVGIYSVDSAELEDGDILYVSINADDVHYADYMSQFDATDIGFVYRNEEITLDLTGHLGMSWDPDEPLDNVKIGIWKDGKFEPIDGAVTDKDGKVTFSFADEGEYLITANGTVRRMIDTDWDYTPDTEADCPIMAPYCFVEVVKNEDAEAALPVIKAINALPPVDELTVDDKAAVEEARALYNALGDDAKLYVDDDTLKQLGLAETMIGKLEAEAKLAEAQDALDEAMKQLENKEAMEKILAAMEETLEQAKAELMDGDNSFLNKALKSLISATQNSLEAAKDALTKTREALKESAAKVNELKAKVEEASEKLAKAIEEGVASAEEIEALKKEVQDAKDELEKAQAEAADNAKELNDLKDKIAKAQADLDKVSAELKNAQETIKIQKKVVKKVKAKAAKKKAKVSWKSLGKGYTYQVFKATKVNGKYKKAATAKKAKAVVKKLKSKKTYFIKVRAFKKVGGKKVFTQFSDPVKVKAK